MSSARRSTRLASSQDSSPPKQDESPQATAGTKRKSNTSQSPIAKRGKKSAPKQQTIEESMDVEQPDESNAEPIKDKNGESSDAQKQPEAKDASAEEKPAQSNGDHTTKAAAPESKDTSELQPAQPTSDGRSDEVHKQEALKKSQAKPQEETQAKPQEKTPEEHQQKAAEASNMDDTGAIKPTEQAEVEEKPAANGDTAVEAHARDDETPAEILEKGVIYFFIKGRIGIEDPAQVNDIARSYMILRPIPHGAKLGEGTIGSGDSKCRLLALPKKVLPISGKDKFMVFVEEAKTSFSELKESFLSASDYATQTVGVRHAPSANPVAEGVYAITTTGRESHLAYMLTIPQELGEVQKDIGLREQGSFVTSVKNPQYAGPANTNLPEGPGFPKEILEEFRGLRWCPLQPKFLDYENCQFLIIGEDSGIDKALDPQGQGSDGTGAEMKEEMEKLEGEDEIRIKHLQGDDTIFADLGISKKDYNLQTTWGS